MKKFLPSFIIGAAVGALAVIVSHHIPKTGKSLPKNEKRISLDNLIKMRKAYLKNPLYTKNSDGMNVPLHCFTFSREDIVEILDHNVIGAKDPKYPDGKANGIALILAANPNNQIELHCKDSSSYMQNVFTIAMVGTGDDGNLLLPDDENTADPDASNIFDHADPCPPNCPDNLAKIITTDK